MQAGSPRGDNEPGEGDRRLEEAELAARVGTRRAAAAEAEVDRLKRLLQDAEKQAESLAWQVGKLHAISIQLGLQLET